VDVASLGTRSEQRDTHLRSVDFFDVEKYPHMTFTVTGIEPVEGETYIVKGDLTIKDVTRPIALEATIEGRMPDPFGAKERLGISAVGQLNRMDFGLNWDGVAGAVPFAGHTIKLNLDAEIVVKAAETAAA
jgi:polyisoprenoid-binding protein YceI